MSATTLDVWYGQARSAKEAAILAENEWYDRWKSYDMLEPELTNDPAERDGYHMYRVVFVTYDTINVEPNWDGMRTWVLHIYKTDPMLARKIAADMGREAPDLP